MNKTCNAKSIRLLLVTPLPSKKQFGGIASWSTRFIKDLTLFSNLHFNVVNSAFIDKKEKDIINFKKIKLFFKKFIFNKRLYKQFKKEIKQFKPNIVHLNTSCTPLACIRDYFFLKFSKRKNIKTILHCRCNIQDQLHEDKVGKHFFKKNIKLAASVFTLNSFSYNYVLKEKKNGGNIFVIPNFIDFSYVYVNKRTNDKLKEIVFVGHLVKQKGIDEIVTLAEEFKDIHFTIVGEYTNEYKESYIFPCNVAVTGILPIESVINKLDEADLFLFPTHTEGFSNALLEAMARGLPIVATNVGANKDMIENKGGIIVESKSVEQLTAAINKMLDKDIRNQMSKWNIEKVKNNYITDIVVKQIVDIYVELVK